MSVGQMYFSLYAEVRALNYYELVESVQLEDFPSRDES